MAVKTVARSRKSMYKTGIMICVATIFFSFGTFVKTLPQRHNVNVNVTSARGRGGGEVGKRHDGGRSILWADEPWIYNYDPDAECRDIHDLETIDEKCDFVESVDDCSNSEGFFEYTNFVYCDIGSEAGGMIILILWWLFCFVGLAVCADDFFCPSLVVITKTLGLSNNVAGVTFLAFGNGAPDLFSAIAALGDIEDGDSGLAVGGLFGAGMFVTTVVVGTIAVIKPFKAMERPFLRDACFYLAGVYWTFFVLWKGKMTLGESIGYILAYFLYVGVVVASGSIYKKQKEKELAKNPPKPAPAAEGEAAAADGVDTTELKVTQPPEPPAPKLAKGDTNVASSGNRGSFKAVGEPFRVYEGQDNKAFTGEGSGMQKQLSIFDNLGMIDDQIEAAVQNEYENQEVQEEVKEEEDEIEELTTTQELLKQINPINTDDWGDMKVYEKGYEIFKSPIVFVITLTCPVVNYEDEVKNNWCRYLQCIQCVLGPPICLLLIGFGTVKIGDVFPVWALSMLIGLAVACLIFFTSVNEEKPKYHSAFGYAEFFIAIIWIYVIANEIVSLLQTFGIVFNISNAILGLTLLAWGNSIGDWIADSLMARQGFARMGFAACFGAPFFNLMLGFGLPLLIKMINDGTTEVGMQITGVQLILSVFLMGNMIMVMVILVVMKFKVRRPVGIYLLCYYLTFLTMALLCETGVILEGWEPTAEIKSAVADFY